ncbi:MAG: hypothetical protein C4531_17710 [Desulfurivibrio sp.]|nr:MAG: hypothetical protein C4531_17710 [Desulfurivibrio sp.]
MLFFYMTSEFIHITLKIRDVKHIICHDWRWLQNNKGLFNNSMVKIALRCGPDLVAAIEQNRRHSRATSRIL